MIGLAVVVFDRWMWRWPGIHRLVGRPRLDGTWHVELRPHPDSRIPRGGNRGPIHAYMLIEQTYWSLHAVLMTAESSSSSRTAAVRGNQGSQRHVLEFVYGNEPRLEHQPRSRSHTGTCLLTITERIPQTLSGRYWTDRLTMGDMDLTYLDRATTYASFSAVQQVHPDVGVPPE
ncbi:Cap15 family cyclic dinucleotide receptor domain-containing protein [Streptomyces luteolus]